MSIKTKIQAAQDIISMQCIKNKPPFNVMSIEDTINAIIDNKLSVSRYGDGEVYMMADQMVESFQTYDKKQANRLKYIINNPIKNHMVCIPAIFENLSRFSENVISWFNWFTKRKMYLYYRYFDINKTYGNSYITRCYMDLKDKSDCPNYFTLLQKIWQDKDIVFIEGEFSRLGVGNDLFDNAKSIKRILAPSKNAYLSYDTIMSEARKIDKNALILIALGATATSLAYDLAKEGYWAIDCGHVDIEYEWMRMGALEKVPVPSKYVNEVGAEGQVDENLTDKKYLSEIIAKIHTKY